MKSEFTYSQAKYFQNESLSDLNEEICDFLLEGEFQDDPGGDDGFGYSKKAKSHYITKSESSEYMCILFYDVYSSPKEERL